MTAAPSGESYVRRNLPLLIVGFAAIVAIVGTAIIVLDRASAGGDDDGNSSVAAQRDRDRTADRDQDRDDSDGVDDGRLEQLLEEFATNRLLLGISLDEEAGGLVVSRVLVGTPAADAGIEIGDEIVAVNGETVETVDELRDAIAAVDVGGEYELTVRRDGNSHDLTVARQDVAGGALAMLLERLRAEGFDAERFLQDPNTFRFTAPDFRLQPGPDGRFTFRVRPALGATVVQTDDGIRVVAVAPGSVAAQAGLQEGDVVLEVNGTAVDTIEELRAALPQGADAGSASLTVELLVERDGRELTLEASFAAVATERTSPLAPSLPNATPVPDQSAQRLGEDLEQLKAYVQSDEFIEAVSARLVADVERLLAGRDAAETDQPPSETGTGPAAFEDLDVFRGTVSVLTDSQITLDGPRGAIGFAINDGTTLVGGDPAVGRTSTVAANADRDAVLILTVS
jgi:membrane-associated protease RseP (regulator of RpoE activity)